jgi:hypothetical protein
MIIIVIIINQVYSRAASTVLRKITETAQKCIKKKESTTYSTNE